MKLQQASKFLFDPRTKNANKKMFSTLVACFTPVTCYSDYAFVYHSMILNDLRICTLKRIFLPAKNLFNINCMEVATDVSIQKNLADLQTIPKEFLKTPNQFFKNPCKVPEKSRASQKISTDSKKPTNE